MMVRVALLVCFASATVIAVYVLGCGPLEEPIPLDTFESECDGVPCGWSAAFGEVGWGETIHPGLHGLVLEGGARAVADSPITGAGYRVVVIGACFDGSRLIADGPDTSASDGTPTFDLFDPETEGDFELQSWPRSGAFGSWSGTITALEATPGGGCVVDELAHAF